jgi:hypothetical protein
MSKQEDTRANTPADAANEMNDTGNAATRADEDGDVAEPDAPTGVEENVGMSTILGGGAGTGVQTDAGDE